MARTHSSPLWLIVATLAALPLPACTNDDDDASPDDPAEQGAAGDDWRTLISADWEIAPGVETYKCVYHTVEEDLYVTSFQGMSPPGTHHTVLTAGPVTRPDGVYDCESGLVLGDDSIMLHGTGVGTDPSVYPEGVVGRVRAGQQLALSLHLYNTTDEPISGRSGTQVRTVSAAQASGFEVGEVVLMGRVTLAVPPGQTTHKGTCVMNGDVTLFGLAPHMHNLGTHLKVVAETATDPELVLYDEPYDFDAQTVRPIGPLELAAGDKIHVYCTYDNTTGATVPFGDSSYEEMCFAGISRFPALGGTFGITCAN